MSAPRHVVLVGLMGSGKTTIGRIVADRLGRRLVDTDLTIEATTGRTVREIWRSDGEAAFRVLERAVVVDALSGSEPSVVAAAGGVVLAESNRALINDADATVVWLAAPADVLAARAMTGEHRPLLDDDPVGTLRSMAETRSALYAAVADHVIEVAEQEPLAVADEIVRLVDSG